MKKKQIKDGKYTVNGGQALPKLPKKLIKALDKIESIETMKAIIDSGDLDDDGDATEDEGLYRGQTPKLI